jgi:hypothetical protein
MTPSSRPRSWAACADAIGHCALIFAFVPPLAALPRWIAFEATNRLNLEDPLVAVFLPVRGTILLLNEFREGVVPGVVAGVLDGVLLGVWVAWRDADMPIGRQLLVGAISGLLAAGLMVAGTLVAAGDRSQAVPIVAVLFELGSAVICGMIAAPTAIRLLTAASAPAYPRPSSSERPRSSRAGTSRPG